MLITRNNYEEFFLLYVDGELSAGDRIAVEKFITANPDLLEELNLLKETVLIADDKIVFEHKEELYKEEKKKVIGFYWWRVAAAVILLFSGGVWGWKYLNKTEISKPQIAVVPPAKKADMPALSAKPEMPVNSEPASTKEKQSRDSEKTPTIERWPLTHAGAVEKEPAVKKENIAIIEEIKLTFPTDQSSTAIELPKENVAINVVPQKLNNEQLIQTENKIENKTLAYEYVDPSEDDMIYVANTSVSKRNKLRGVFRKATRILDRVTSTN